MIAALFAGAISMCLVAGKQLVRVHRLRADLALAHAEAATSAATISDLKRELELLGIKHQHEKREAVREQERLQKELQTAHQRSQALSEASSQLERRVAELSTTLKHEQHAGQEKLALLTEAKSQLTDAFRSASSEALRHNNQQFLELATQRLEQQHMRSRQALAADKQAVEHLVQPIGEAMGKVREELSRLERERLESRGQLGEHLRTLAEGQEKLRSETGNLVSALRTPHVSGRWGEMQLRRVVEMAGMLAHCDFTEQPTVASQADGRLLRPDLVVRLPGGKTLVVDSKAPCQAYLAANAATDEAARKAHLRSYARAVRDHMGSLGTKAYWAQFSSTPEFVVLFLPGESFYSAALQADPSLIEGAVSQRVVLATPTTLIALLKAVAYGWRQETVAESAREVSALGQELHIRLANLCEHVLRLGKRLGSSVEAYNAMAGTLETRVLVSARRFSQHGAAGGGKQLPAPQPVESSPRTIAPPELPAGPDETASSSNRGAADEQSTEAA